MGARRRGRETHEKQPREPVRFALVEHAEDARHRERDDVALRAPRVPDLLVLDARPKRPRLDRLLLFDVPC